MAAAIGGIATYPSIPNWYAQIVKPTWNPPNEVFGPVWTLLYLLMSFSAWLVWKEVGFRNRAFGFYFVQLFLNTMWSILFFALHRPDLAFLEITALWIAIGMTLISFWKIKPLAGVLFLPYWLWVSFAAFLNFTIWRLNP